MNAKKFVNLSKFLLAGALVLGMTACSSDDDITKGGTETGAKGYMTVSISNDALQRTLNTSSAEPGTDAENAIKKLTIVLVKVADTNTPTANTVALIKSDATFTTSTTSGDNEAKTQPFEVTSGQNYKVYVFANPTAKLLDGITENNTTEAQLLSMTKKASDIGEYANTTNGFMMSNAIDNKGDNTNIPTVAVTTSNNISNPASASNIHVDRFAVKVRINTASTNSGTFEFTLPNGGISVKQGDGNTEYTIQKITLTDWQILNCYQTTNLFQGWANEKIGDGFQNDLLAPNFSDNNNQTDYANNMASFSTRAASGSYVSGYSTLKDNSTDNQFYKLAQVTTTNNSNFNYCFETNPKAIFTLNASTYKETKNINEAPGVIFRAKTDRGNTFYGYKGQYYSSPEAIAHDYPNAFNVVIASTSTTTTYGSIDKAKTLISNSDFSSLRTQYGIQAYPGGVMYYTFYIRDSHYTTNYANYNIAALTTPENYYALMRNSIYNLNIKSISGIGTDIPFGWNTDNTPVDQEKTYMQVEVVVNQWALNSYDVNF